FCVQFLVITFGIYQLIMRSLLDYFAFFQNNNFICIFCGRNAVAYNNCGFVFCNFVQILKNFFFDYSVNGRKTIVKKKNFRILKYCPCNGNPLFLPNAQSDSAFAQNCVVSFIETNKIFVDRSVFRSSNNFFLGSVFLSKTNVISK